MITTIHTALAAKRDQLNKDDKGFTLIELLVVVLIIGILAAIAIPVFLGQQKSAQLSQVESDLGNAKVALISEMVSDSTFTVSNGALPTLDDFTPSAEVNITIENATADGFCLEGTHDLHTGAADVFSTTSDGSVVNAACATPATP